MQWVGLSSHELFISPVLLNEIARTPGPRRAVLEKTVREMGATLVAVSAEAEELARHYAAARIVPARFQDDGAACCNGGLSPGRYDCKLEHETLGQPK